MGGLGSTRWGAHQRAWTVEECLRLRVAALAPAVADPGTEDEGLWLALWGGRATRWRASWCVQEAREGAIPVDLVYGVEPRASPLHERLTLRRDTLGRLHGQCPLCGRWACSHER